MKRRAIQLLCSMSLVLSVATVATWIAGYYRPARVAYSWAPQRHGVNVESRTLILVVGEGLAKLEYFHQLERPASYDGRLPIEQWLRGWWADWLEFPALTEASSFGWQKRTFGSDPYFHVYAVEAFAWLPLWSVAVLFLVPPSTYFLQRRRARHRPLSNRCTHCGYDLRASPLRCPECGQSVG